EPIGLGDDVVERPADLLASRIGHDAERAVLAATLHDRQEGRARRGLRLWNSVEFLDLGEADVDDPGTAGADLGDHLRQPMQRLRTEHDVDERRSLQDRLALLARDAASDPDDGVRLIRLELAPAAEQRE